MASSYDKEHGPIVHLILGETDMILAPEEAKRVAWELHRALAFAEIHAALQIGSIHGQGDDIFEAVHAAMQTYDMLRGMGIERPDVVEPPNGTEAPHAKA